MKDRVSPVWGAGHVTGGGTGHTRLWLLLPERCGVATGHGSAPAQGQEAHGTPVPRVGQEGVGTRWPQGQGVTWGNMVTAGGGLGSAGLGSWGREGARLGQ